jgi:hypothetical protein
MKPLRLLLIGLLLVCGAPVYCYADLSITTANVKVGGPEAVVQTVQFGEIVTNGQLVYLKTSDSKYWLVDNDASATSNIAGVVLTGNSANGYGTIISSGPIAIGASVTVGRNYMSSSAAGGIGVDTDVATGDWISSLGHSTSTGVIWVNIKNYKIVK